MILNIDNNNDDTNDSNHLIIFVVLSSPEPELELELELPPLLCLDLVGNHCILIMSKKFRNLQNTLLIRKSKSSAMQTLKFYIHDYKMWVVKIKIIENIIISRCKA